MKGSIFLELLEMAEANFGEETVDRILDSAELESRGAYTSVGTYSCKELVTLVTAFSDHSGIAPNELQRLFGHWMMTFFTKRYGVFFEDKHSAFDILEAIEGEIHVEVRKLYPEAELPSFSTQRIGGEQLELVYTSPRPLAPFCKGLIEGCLEIYDQKASIAASAVPDAPQSTKFLISLENQT
ncbi:heme NO-binding domain-containing protein [Pseudoprimorskyibacter insulae]|uniref:Heme NO-binding domain-containing protein n=1 Tax=Pseudoprimorskyibacter insulae TaxID=1695997 RepID=A0A2R8B0N7_9RHOB|nr:heme NO-binding domain-containing protein [Pseudoprimorskyibacter insulae]SPF81831.1 hypothetical protein PRI8871_03656 [Pseudoprimorskyibacter insulae]